MINRTTPGKMTFAVSFAIAASSASADDLRKYPDFRAQWNRADSAQFDPSKPAGNAQKAPLNAEYQAMFDATTADRNLGGLADNYTASCLPGGMPRAMIGYEPIDFI